MNSVSALVKHFSSISAMDEDAGFKKEFCKTPTLQRDPCVQGHDNLGEANVAGDDSCGCSNALVEVGDGAEKLASHQTHNDINGDVDDKAMDKNVKEAENEIISETETKHAVNKIKPNIKQDSKNKDGVESPVKQDNESSECFRAHREEYKGNRVLEDSPQGNHQTKFKQSTTKVAKKRAAPRPPVKQGAISTESNSNNDQLPKEEGAVQMREAVGISPISGVVSIVDKKSHSNKKKQDSKNNRISYPVLLNPFADNTVTARGTYENETRNCKSNENEQGVNSLNDGFKEIKNKQESAAPGKPTCVYPDEFNPFTDSDENESIDNDSRSERHVYNILSGSNSKVRDNRKFEQNHNAVGKCTGTSVSCQPAVTMSAIGANVAGSPSKDSTISPRTKCMSPKKKRAPAPPPQTQVKAFEDLTRNNKTDCGSYPDELNPF